MPMTFDSKAVTGLQMAGVGSVFTFGASGSAYFGTLTSSSSAGGLPINTSLQGVSGHRVTWTELR